MQKLEVRLRQIPIPELPVEERIRTFSEVALGYAEEQALAESSRCLQCSQPLCVELCPIHVDIPGFIGALERFVADYGLRRGIRDLDTKPSTGKSVAVVGSGPAGLSVAAELARMGHHTVIFEALHEPGGVLVYGIPEFRLPKEIVKQEINYIMGLGVEVKTNIIIGRTLTIDDLFEDGFNAVFLGTGAGLPKLLNIPGENLCGVYSINEFLIRINLMKAYLFPYKSKTPIRVKGKVAVLGARGMDAARSAIRLGAEEVCIFYQRRIVGRKDDIRRGVEEGVKLQPLTKPIKIIGNEDGWVKAVELKRLKPINDTYPSLTPEPSLEFLYNAGTVIIANKHIPNTIAAMNTLKSIRITEREKTIIVNPETLEATDGVFAGGDVVSGASSVIKAIEAGRRAAQSIDRYLTGNL
jgi:glutamate synthase (NADPH/NADH) small chain